MSIFKVAFVIFWASSHTNQQFQSKQFLLDVQTHLYRQGSEHPLNGNLDKMFFSPENIHVSETSDTMLNTFTLTKALTRSMRKEQADTCFQLMQSVAYW